MDQATYDSLVSNYRILYNSGKVRLDELKDYITNEKKIECNSDSDSSFEYVLFGQKLRTQLQCSFSDIRSKKSFIVTYTEVEDENRIKILSFTREVSFDSDGKMDNADDYPAGHFLEIFDSFRKKFSVRRLNLVNG
jgi:hypothetical protein